MVVVVARGVAVAGWKRKRLASVLVAFFLFFLELENLRRLVFFFFFALFCALLLLCSWPVPVLLLLGLG